ncbi:hypothetical protein ACWENQ_07655 [Nonomuraea sp. NPDC004354]
MKLRLIAALSCVTALGLSGTATAEAYPVKQKVLTENGLYRMGKLPKSTCEEQPVARDDRAAAKRYIGGVMQCLEATWEQYLSENGVRFEGARLKFVSSGYCDINPKWDSDSVYCHDARAVVFKLGRSWLDDPSDLWLLHSTATIYAHHVQRLVDIVYSVDGQVFYDSQTERAERVRRYNLQAACLSGAFVKSVWPLEGRSSRDWKYLLSIVQGDAPGHRRLYGKTANVRLWVGRGFATGDPGACNTWTAPAAEVA